LSSLSITGNEFGKEGRQKQLEEAGYKQTSEFAPSDENGNILRNPNLAKSSSSGPVEDVFLRKKMVKKSRISMKVTEWAFCLVPI
jgi:hypothetical protein